MRLSASVAMASGAKSMFQPPNGLGSAKISILAAAAAPCESDSQKPRRLLRAAATPLVRPDARSAALMAPALEPLTAVNLRRFWATSSSSRSRTPQVNAPCDPPPCSASAMLGIPVCAAGSACLGFACFLAIADFRRSNRAHAPTRLHHLPYRRCRGNATNEARRDFTRLRRRHRTSADAAETADEKIDHGGTEDTEK